MVNHKHFVGVLKSQFCEKDSLKRSEIRVPLWYEMIWTYERCKDVGSPCLSSSYSSSPSFKIFFLNFFVLVATFLRLFLKTQELLNQLRDWKGKWALLVLLVKTRLASWCPIPKTNGPKYSKVQKRNLRKYTVKDTQGLQLNIYSKNWRPVWSYNTWSGSWFITLKTFQNLNPVGPGGTRWPALAKTVRDLPTTTVHWPVASAAAPVGWLPALPA